MTNLTQIEAQALRGIIASEYQGGLDVVDYPVWTWSANTFDNKKTFSGAVASLVKKALAEVAKYDGEDVISITQTGFDALKSHKD